MNLGKRVSSIRATSEQKENTSKGNIRLGDKKMGSHFVAALKRCSRAGDLEEGRKIHLEASASGFHTDRFVAAALVTMYSKCRVMASAQEVFDIVLVKDVVLWTSLILGYVDNGDALHALELFNRMDCQPDSFTYVAALKACGVLASQRESEKHSWLDIGVKLHNQVRQRELESNLVVATTLLVMYSKCRSMDSARQVFDSMPRRNVVTWTSIILGYVENGQSSAALELFSKMDCQPNSLTYVAVLKACGALAAESQKKQAWLEKGMVIHKRVEEAGLALNLVVATTLVDMYSKCGCMHLAREVFDTMIHRDPVAWTSLMLGYVENGDCSTALNLFARMDCEPDCFSFAAALMACGGLAAQKETQKRFCLETGVEIHKRVKARGFHQAVAANLVDMYSRCGNMELAKKVFDEMNYRNVLAWTSLIRGYMEIEEFTKSLELFAQMDCEPDSFTFVAALKACIGLASSEKKLSLEQGARIHQDAKERGFLSDIVLASSLVDMYIKCGDMKLAREVFDGMSHRNVITWTSLILGYIDDEKYTLALELFSIMNCEPDSLAYVAALKACGGLASFAAGQEIHGEVCRRGLEREQVVATSLMYMYGKCGRMKLAEELFNSLRSPDLVSWNTLLGGYSSLGQSSHVLRLLRRMKEASVQLNGITYISLLMACSHAGLVDEAMEYFDSMLASGVSPSLDHFNCMVDILGRANKLQEALDVIRGMPFKAETVTWMILLGACRKWNNVEIGKIAFDALGDAAIKPAAYVLMSDLYGSSFITKNRV